MEKLWQTKAMEDQGKSQIKALENRVEKKLLDTNVSTTSFFSKNIF